MEGRGEAEQEAAPVLFSSRVQKGPTDSAHACGRVGECMCRTSVWRRERDGRWGRGGKRLRGRERRQGREEGRTEEGERGESTPPLQQSRGKGVGGEGLAHAWPRQKQRLAEGGPEAGTREDRLEFRIWSGNREKAPSKGPLIMGTNKRRRTQHLMHTPHSKAMASDAMSLARRMHVATGSGGWP